MRKRGNRPKGIMQLLLGKLRHFVSFLVLVGVGTAGDCYACLSVSPFISYQYSQRVIVDSPNFPKQFKEGLT